MAYNLLETRNTYYVGTNTSTPDTWDIRGFGSAYYDQTTEDLINNRSRIKLSFGVKIVGSWYGQYKVTGTIYKKVSGSWISVSTDTYQSSLGTLNAGTYTRGTLTNVYIPHDIEGNAQVRVSVTVTGQSGVTGSRNYAYTYDLPTIEEQASITNVITEEMNATLIGYGITNNQYVNQLSKKKYTVSVYNPNELTITRYDIVNTNQIASISLSNVIILDYNNKDIYTEFIDNTTRPVVKAYVHFDGGAVIHDYVSYNDNTFINYQKPQFIPTSCTTKRNGQLSGLVTLNLQGTYYNGSVGTLNQGETYKPTIKYKIWKKEDTEPATYDYTIPANSISINNGTFSVSSYEIGSQTTTDPNYFNYNYAYNVKLEVSDTFLSSETTCDVTRGVAIWTEYKDRVDFEKITSRNIETDKINAGNIDYGSTSITPTANTPTSVSITFNKTFSTPPLVFPSVESAVIGSVVRGVSVANVTTTGCDIYIYRTNTTSTNVNWFAIGN